jgi:uncharacterized protein YjiS (DUF1127 family)
LHLQCVQLCVFALTILGKRVDAMNCAHARRASSVAQPASNRRGRPSSFAAMDSSIRPPLGQRANSPANAWQGPQGLWQRWRLRLRTRAELRGMDARALADVGLDHDTARRELRKFFWQC